MDSIQESYVSAQSDWNIFTRQSHFTSTRHNLQVSMALWMAGRPDGRTDNAKCSSVDVRTMITVNVPTAKLQVTTALNDSHGTSEPLQVH